MLGDLTPNTVFAPVIYCRATLYSEWRVDGAIDEEEERRVEDSGEVVVIGRSYAQQSVIVTIVV